MSLFLFSSTLKIILIVYLQDIVQKQWINIKCNHPFLLNTHWKLLIEKALILIVKRDTGAWSSFHLHMLTTLPFNHSRRSSFISSFLFYFQIYIYMYLRKTLPVGLRLNPFQSHIGYCLVICILCCKNCNWMDFNYGIFTFSVLPTSG